MADNTTSDTKHPSEERIGYLAIFRSSDYLRYQLARMVVVLASEAQALTVSWQVYSITHRAIDLGYTGLVLFLPRLLVLLPAGHVADRYNRRNVILIFYALQLLGSIALFLLAWNGPPPVWAIWTALFGIGLGRAFSGPASTAMLPQLIDEKHFVLAVTWGSGIFQFANITGPALGGVLYALPLARMGLPRIQGAPIVYLFTMAALCFFLIMLAGVHPRPVAQEKRAISLKVLLAGFVYVRHSQMLLGSFTLDLFAVMLGGATALLPIYAAGILRCGPTGLGVLRAAPAVGSLCMTFVLARFPIRRKAGHKMFFGVAMYGLAIALFSCSRNLWLSALVLAISGAADMFSVIVRQSILQLATPQHMRGRVSAIASLCIGASNDIGEFESGVTAQWWGAVRATLAGGIAAMAIAGAWTRLFPILNRTDELTSEALTRLVEER
jgi:MFS family permease